MSPVAAAAVLVLGLIVAPPALARVSVAPKLARTVVVSRVSGRVSVEGRGAHAFSNLTGPRSIPVGSTVDAMDGNVRLVTANTTSGTTQYGLFDGGVFVVTQDRSGLATLRLVAGRQATAVCGGGPRRARAAALPASVLRLLHGTAHGRFRTTGRYAAATVRGTRWTTIDTCTATAITDNSGVVATQANDGQLSYVIRRGEEAVYRCAANGQPPVSRQYCTAALLSETTSVIAGRRVRAFEFGTGVITKSPDTTAELCVTGPRRTVCTTYPLQAAEDELRAAVALCVPWQGPGNYSLAWKIRGVALGAPLTFTAPVGAAFEPCVTWVGQPLIGSGFLALAADIKTVNRYTLPTVAHARDIKVFLRPSGLPGQQVLTGILYADSGGVPGTLVGTTAELTYSSTDPPGWYALTFPRRPTPQNPSGLLVLAPGNYWIGVITGAAAGIASVAYDTVAGFQDYNANPYSSGPTNPFGPVNPGDEQLSLYMEYFAPPF